MKTLGYCMTVVCVMNASLMGSVAWGSGADAQAPMNCANFRCHFGDVPKAAPPLIAAPFVSFYRDEVVKPMRPYHDWEPTARKLPNARAGRRNVAGQADKARGNEETSLSKH
ncbi:hypothetical protein [Salinicola socius]|uniref:Uncharacterized protein n=1 Tax=Salinicola socius TaxID=404433 RepID=A0A1Q8SUK1_9GAMM|nr:hypothetical protein [Salinicola socius]OLO05125.1 hypothetical protein BTW07_05800 [Salinicola socius]